MARSVRLALGACQVTGRDGVSGEWQSGRREGRLSDVQPADRIGAATVICSRGGTVCPAQARFLVIGAAGRTVDDRHPSSDPPAAPMAVT